jgi:hypothetical protein
LAGAARRSKTKQKPGFPGAFVDSPLGPGFTLLGLWGALRQTGSRAPSGRENLTRRAHAMTQIFLSYARDYIMLERSSYLSTIPPRTRANGMTPTRPASGWRAPPTCRATWPASKPSSVSPTRPRRRPMRCAPNPSNACLPPSATPLPVSDFQKTNNNQRGTLNV